MVTLKDEENAPASESSTTTSVKPRQHHPAITHQVALKHACLIFAVLCYYFVCDYWHYFARAERIYNRDLFIFLLALLFIVNVVYTSRVLPETSTGSSGGVSADKLLNRDQTEEWKGWMQVMFVWYHYYRAAETYNLIRLFIASYVWMTGFGRWFLILWLLLFRIYKNIFAKVQNVFFSKKLKLPLI